MTFNDLPLNEKLLSNLRNIGFETPTEIQTLAIPYIINESNDLIALAQTGTGKTAAFGLPILNNIEFAGKFPKALILCPTRELAIQIEKELNIYIGANSDLNTAVVYGGASINTQISDLKNGCDIVVGTPGRTLDLIKRKVLKLQEIEYFVLDEADEMLNMGFKDELDAIISHLPSEKRTLLFSATFPKEVAQLSKNYLINPYQITVGTKNTASKQITHQYCIVKSSDKLEALKRIIDSNNDMYAIVFCRTKKEVQEVADKLIDAHYNADAIHGDLSQAQREHIIRKFRKKNIKIMVATDVVARGLDINNLSHVLHMNLPDDPEVYVHRSGRTGRAGKKGISVCIIHSRENRKLKEIGTANKVNFDKILIPNGKEIGEKMLQQFLEKVRETTINPEIAEHLMEIEARIGDLDKDEMIAKFVSLAFSQMITKYKHTEDINVEIGSEKYSDKDFDRKNSKDKRKNSRENTRDRNPRDRDRNPRDRERNGKERNAFQRDGGWKSGKPNVKFTKLKLSVGTDEGFKRKDFFEIINSGGCRKAEIGEIEIQNNRSFVQVENNFATAISQALKKSDINTEILS